MFSSPRSRKSRWAITRITGFTSRPQSRAPLKQEWSLYLWPSATIENPQPQPTSTAKRTRGNGACSMSSAERGPGDLFGNVADAAIGDDVAAVFEDRRIAAGTERLVVQADQIAEAARFRRQFLRHR